MGATKGPDTKQELKSQRERVMRISANSLRIVSQSKLPLGTRLLRTVIAAQQLKADREIRRYSSFQHEAYRQEFGLELERRMLGQ
jgi:hypothetical protein